MDEKCSYNNMEYPNGSTGESSVFSGREYHDYFYKYFDHHCGGKNNCTLTTSRIKYSSSDKNVINSDPDYRNFDFENLDQNFDILAKISDYCIQSMQYLKKTSTKFIVIVGC